MQCMTTYPSASSMGCARRSRSGCSSRSRSSSLDRFSIHGCGPVGLHDDSFRYPHYYFVMVIAHCGRLGLVDGESRAVRHEVGEIVLLDPRRKHWPGARRPGCRGSRLREHAQSRSRRGRPVPVSGSRRAPFRPAGAIPQRLASPRLDELRLPPKLSSCALPRSTNPRSRTETAVTLGVTIEVPCFASADHRHSGIEFASRSCVAFQPIRFT